MKIEVNIKNRHALIILLFIIAASTIGLVVAYGGTTPSAMGHSWGEMYCPGCIISANLGDNSVTGIKIQDGAVTGADIQDSSVTGADIQDGSIAKADLATGIIFDGLGATVPASTTCLCHDPAYPYNPPTTATLLPNKMIANNNRIAMEYSRTNACTNCGTQYTCQRYYFGNSEWSACTETSVACECIIIGGG